jgi:ankyrin repeat protein
MNNPNWRVVDPNESDEDDDMQLITLQIQAIKLNDDLLMNASLGNFDSVLNCLRNGANVCSQDEHGHTPLILAVDAGHSKVVGLLLEQKAQVGYLLTSAEHY